MPKPIVRAALACVALSAAPAYAQQTGAFPDRTIRFIVPAAPGGGIDVTARLIAQVLQDKQGVQAVIENRAGSNGTIGGLAVQQSAPDGYTLVYSAATFPMARHVMSKVPYDPIGDFTPIARTGEAPLVMVIANKLPQTSLKDVAASVKAAPQEWTAGVPTLGSPGHLATILFGKLAGASVTVLPFRGTAPALNDVAGGHIQMLIDAAIVLVPASRQGTVRAIAMTAGKRSSLAPEIPTAAEGGLPGMEVATWYGAWGPKGVPAPIVAKLNAMINAATVELARTGKLTPLGIEPVTETPEQFGRFVDAEVARNAELLKLANFKPSE